MTYYPSDCPNTPRVFEPDALSFRGGGGSGVALREARAEGSSPHRSTFGTRTSRRTASPSSLFIPKGKGEDGLGGGEDSDRGQARTRFTSPTVGIERKPYFTCK